MKICRVKQIANCCIDRFLALRVLRTWPIPASVAALLVTAFFSSTAMSQEDPTPTLMGVVSPHTAPAWDIEEWINTDPGNIDDNRDRVIVIDFFQLWCPACNSFSGPLMQQWQDRFSEEIASNDLLLLKIHTVFEGHDVQTTERLKEYLIEKNITMPVGVDRHIGNDHLPETKKRYQTRGTPEIVFIDRQGMIRFKRFGGFDPVAAETYLELLLGSTDSMKRLEPIKICLASELCG